MLKCQEELSQVPKLARWLKARGKKAEQTDERPLEGMEIALTINHMIGDSIDPDADQDDLCYGENTVENFNKLVVALKRNDMPPTVDFIAGRTLNEHIQEAWLREGNLLGNMTYSRKKPKKTTAQEFVEDVKRNDQALAGLWKKYPSPQRYFRFPGLTLTNDKQKLEQIRDYLRQKRYIEVPVTIDAGTDLFAQSYCGALERGDQSCAAFIKANFKSLLLDRTIDAREAGRKVAGHQVKHILMLNAGQLACDTLGEILSWYKALGAHFISLDEALRDPIYVGNPTGLGNEIIWETEHAQLSGGK